MSSIYLFDWGDTLMVDFPKYCGKMCDWEEVEAVSGAKNTLKYLSQSSKIYVATGASESSEEEIKSAFKKVELDEYISGYFCKANLGIEKGSVAFFKKIIEKLDVPFTDVMMVGDSLSRDIEPALQLGINVAWFRPDASPSQNCDIRVINKLEELC